MAESTRGPRSEQELRSTFSCHMGNPLNKYQVHEVNMSTNILIVDDEDRYLRLMDCNLSAEGYNVLKASNGQEAIDVAVK